MGKYLVELERGCWLADWKGDPGRTVVWANAKRFEKTAAKTALTKARRYRTLPNAKIIKDACHLCEGEGALEECQKCHQMICCGCVSDNSVKPTCEECSRNC